MKLRKSLRKALAYICAIALVITSITGYRANVNAADYSALEYQDIMNNQNNEFAANLKGSQIAVAEGGLRLNVKQFQNAGFNELYLAVAGISAANLAVTANGQKVETEGTGIRMYNAKDFLTYEYNVIKVTSDGGNGVIIVYCPENAGAGTYEEGGDNPNPPETEETTTLDPTQWQDATAATGNWKENSAQAWNMWAGNGATAQYKNANKVDDFSIKIDAATGDWSIQAATKIVGLTAGTLYDYTIVVESDREGVRVGTKDDYSNSSLVYTNLVEGRNELKGTLTAAQAAAMMMLELGNAANAGATITVKGVEIKEHVSQTTVEYGKNITADATWLGWFEQEVWANYTVSEEGTGYTLTDKNIGANWYSIQTGIDNIEFLEAKYACEFTLTASSPKKFKVDNRSNDAVVFTEAAEAEWTENGNGTYSYKYKGTFDSATHQFINVRIALGYFAEDENYAANDTATFTVSDFKIYAVDPNGEETTPAPTEPAPVEKGDVALSGYNWAIQTPGTEFTPSEYNGYGFTVQGIAADADQWSYGALLDAIEVTNGETYTLTMNVKSTVNKVVPIEFTNGTAINRTIAATPEGTTFTYKFTAKADTVKIYMPLGINGDDVEITDAYDITISDVQFDVTEPDETEPQTTVAADGEVTILEPAFAFDSSAGTKHYELHWNTVEGAATYTAYVDVEDEEHIARAYYNNYSFNKIGQTHVDHIAGEPGQTQKFIVVAYDADGALLARGIKEVTIPELTESEKAAAAIAAKFNSEDNYAKGATAIVSSGNDAQNIVDGNMGSRWQASAAGEDHAAGSEFFGVNLGEVKTIGQVVIAFEASYAAAYDVYVAGTDEVYGDTPVASGTADANNLISTVNFDEVEAQYVKVVVTEFSENASTYGTSVYEIAVLPKAEEETTPAPTETDTTPAPTETTPVTGEKPAAPAGLVHAPADDGTLPFHFAWGPVEGATSYKVYLNDEYVAEVTAPDYNFDEALFAEAGEYIIAVTAVKDGVESDKATVTYTVQGADPGTTPAETDTTPAAVETTTPDAGETTTPAVVETTTPGTVETTTPAVVETTTQAPTTVAPTTTTAAPKTTAAKKLGNTTVKSASKKIASVKVKLTFKKVKGAKKYQVQIAKNKKFKKVLVKKTVKKVKVTIKSKKLKKQKKLFVRVRAVGADKWSKPKKVKIKK